MRPLESSAFPVALDLRGRSVLVIGGGDEAVQKVPKLLAAGARVWVVAPQVADELAQAARRAELVWFARTFSPSDVCGVQVVLLTEIDPGLVERLRALQAGRRFWLCAVDQPQHSDFYLVSTVVRGPVQIAVSTGGRAPLLARRIRQALERGLDAKFGEFARSFARLRASKFALPKAQRSQILERALEGFAMEVSLRYPEPDKDSQGAGYKSSDGARDD